MMMSASSARRLANSWQRASFIFSVTLFLLRAWTYHHSEVPSFSTRHCRIGSPVPGDSILITSAPNSASMREQNGPAISVPSSRTLMPASGPGEVFVCMVGSGKIHSAAMGINAQPENLRSRNRLFESAFRRNSISGGAAVEHRACDGAGIDVLEFAAHRHAARQAAHFQAARLQGFADVVRGRFAFDGEIGRQHHFAHHAVIGARYQLLLMNVLGAAAVEWRQAPR